MINTASFVAVMGAAVSQISYTASKGAVLALSREIGVEFAHRGVRVNCALPGPRRHAACSRSCSPAIRPRPPGVSSTCRSGRFAKASEIASGALFLASDESSYVTASSFMVDGGLSQAYLTPDASDDPQY